MSTEFKARYDQDFYAWVLENAELLRQGRFSEVDIEHVAEELEDMGKSTKRELVSRLAVLLAHLLKWDFQPDRRGNSWRYTIEEQRLRIAQLLRENPSLRHLLGEMFEEAYRYAVLAAARETQLKKELFPQTCPFTLERVLDENYWPD